MCYAYSQRFADARNHSKKVRYDSIENGSLKRHMDSGSRCPIHLTISLGNVVNRAAASEGQMTHDFTQGNFHFNDSKLRFVWEAYYGAWEV